MSFFTLYEPVHETGARPMWEVAALIEVLEKKGVMKKQGYLRSKREKYWTEPRKQLIMGRRKRRRCRIINADRNSKIRILCGSI